MSKQFTVEDVAKHNTAASAWIIIDNEVFDITAFADKHPGGKKIILNESGRDASKKFHQYHSSDTLTKHREKLKIGNIANKETDGTGEKSTKVAEIPVPFSEAPYAAGWHSAYYKDYHLKLRVHVREFVEREIMPYCHEWDEAKALPRELYKKMAEAGLYGGVAGHPWPSEYIDPGPNSIISPDQFDAFCELVFIDELSRCASGGVTWGLLGGMSIGLTPVYKFASKSLKDRVCRPCFNGEKFICLAVTEPDAGSDVANLKATAVKTPDGKHYIVNGTKKWITNGVFADFFTTAVRTGGEGHAGISFLVVERGPGVTTKQMQCMGVWSSGTTYITFEDVKVPVENLIGKEGEGFKFIMFNFTKERWGLSVQATRFARVCLEEAMKYALKRKTFGKRLIEHPVIRFKLAHMARQVEATWALIELITYQMSKMTFKQQIEHLAGSVALLKVQSTQVFEYCAREALQIFGGLGYTRGGQGEKVERLYRDVRAYAIPGGSEEIMADLGIKMSLRSYIMKVMAQKQSKM